MDTSSMTQQEVIDFMYSLVNNLTNN